MNDTMKNAVTGSGSEINKVWGSGKIKLVTPGGAARIRKVILKMRVPVNTSEPEIFNETQDKGVQARFWEQKTKDAGRSLLGKVGRVYGESSNSGREVYHNMQNVAAGQAIAQLEQNGYIATGAHFLVQEGRGEIKVFLVLEFHHKSSVGNLEVLAEKSVRDSIARAKVVMQKFARNPCYCHIWDNLSKMEEGGEEARPGDWDDFRTVTVNLIPMPSVKDLKVARQVQIVSGAVSEIIMSVK